MATKIFSDQFPDGIKNTAIEIDCFVAVAIYQAPSSIFDQAVNSQIGYYYEYLFTALPFNEKYSLLVKEE